ncbi:MAG TPA: histidine ammonia-lyase [Firmicutes bacterium]|nr:histidine ammonia-lyase [Bacillota bacterium]
MNAIVNGRSLTIDQVAAVAGGQQVELAASAFEAMEKARAYVESLISRKQPVYGITTGFGRFSDVVIDAEDVGQLQLNLIRSHACGVGEPLSKPETRALMLLRANALALGHSGARPQLVQLLIDCLNKDVLPVIPTKGSLGASGDLVPLAHMALFLIGEGQAWDQENVIPARQALERAGLTPIILAAKEGLALINGTQFMAARGSLCLERARKLAQAADAIASLTCQALRGIPAAYSPLIQMVRPHPGQQACAANLLKLLEGSKLVSQPGELRTQDAYTLRCIPQVHGASNDAFAWVTEVLEREINSATDNPLIFADEDQVISGGNFHGQPIALVLDYLAIAMAELANISERRLERLVNPQLSDLPPFLTDKGGLNSGLMIAQYVAAALVSENKILCHPASVDSIPSSGNQEDHVSMGANAANKACQVVANLQDVLAIELLAACQAIDYRGPELLSPVGYKIYQLVRSLVSFIDSDRSFHQDIKSLSQLLADGRINTILKGE